MRIAYGVHGYGHGHAVRVGALLPALSARHEVHLFAGGDAPAALGRTFCLPSLRYAYRGARISWLATMARNAGTLLDLALAGPVSRIVAGRLAALKPDLVVSDSEPFLLRAAHALGVPAVALDHVGVIGHGRVAAPWRERPRLALDGAAYRLLVGGADRVILSSFYRPADVPPRVEVVPPILRERVERARPSDGEHLLVYFNAPRMLTPMLRAGLAALGRPVIVYGSGAVGRDGDAVHRAFDPDGFVDDLSSCRAVLATAGHQLICEALHLGKPMLLCPEGTAEQRLNAREAERLGFARVVPPGARTAPGLRRLLEALPPARAPSGELPGSAVAIAVAALERAAAELGERRPAGGPRRLARASPPSAPAR